MPDYTVKGIQYPLKGDLIKDSSVAAKLVQDIRAVAVTAESAIVAEGERAENAAKWYRGRLTSGSADTIETPGLYAVTKASAVGGLPVTLPGHLEVLATPYLMQTFSAWGRVERYMRSTVGGVWQPWVSLEHYKGEAPEPLADLKAPGEYYYRTSQTPDTPFPGAWIAVSVTLNDSTKNVFQTAHATGTPPRVATRSYSNSSKAWTPWVYFALAPQGTEYLTRDSISEITETMGGTSGNKCVPLAMTQLGIGTPQATTAGAVRWARRYAVAPTRARLHIANYNMGWSPWTGADLTVESVTIGKSDASGLVAAPVTLSTAGTIPGDIGEYVTGWADLDLTDGEYLAVTVAWSGGDGSTTNVQLLQGGGWATANPADAASSDTTGWERAKLTPFFVWLEAEVPASTPVVLGVGTSTVTGTASTDPVGDSFISKYAYAQGSLPVLVSHHGSDIPSWKPDAAKWGMYPGVSLAGVADAVVVYVGGNDIAGEGMTVETMKSMFSGFIETLRTKTESPVYVGLLSPSNKPPVVEALRRDFNEWLSGLPGEVRGVIDFPAAIGDAENEDLNPAYSADGLHPNTAGQQQLADRIVEHPVTPYSLPPSKLKALAALL